MEKCKNLENTNEMVQKVSKEIEGGTQITLYREDYLDEGWKIICNDLQITEQSIIDNLQSITIEVSAINKLDLKY